MKRAWGFDHIMTKKLKERASADVGFIFIAYNLKRIMNIIGINQLMEVITSVLVAILTFLIHISLQKQLKQLRIYHF